MEDTKGARDLLLELLAKMGCPYEIDDENDIRFRWQGGYFCAIAENDGAFVTIFYFNWEECELYDIDTVSRMKRVINDANNCCLVTTFYSLNEAATTFHVHSKRQFLLIPQIDDLEGYLQAMLALFFDTSRFIEVEVDKLKNEEERIS